ncbi:MAG: Serine/threonine-protein kinase PknD [Lentisphaerae bacterium ADurb.Bin242]|nr:MAG: Serine/threonine-protein kinase PknD [Lentisphaerae bacterium ADurb.Bin242]
MNLEEEKKLESAKTITISSPDPARDASSRKSFTQTGTLRAMEIPTSRKPNLVTGKKKPPKKKNPSARFSLEVLRTKASITAHLFQKKEIVDDFVGIGLSKFTNIPIDNTPHIHQDEIPRVENNFERLEVFNEGGQGIISAAKDKNLGRIVALKSLREKLPDEENVTRDFITEAKVTAQLDHPSIIPVYALNTDRSNGFHLAMKLINGKTLREHLKNIILNYRLKGIEYFDEKASLFKRLEIFLHVCDAMAYAHHRNIMHCDLKPENIMIGEYMEVYVMDWGLAKIIRSPEDDTTPWVKPETIAGTPRYLSPEAVHGRKCDERADIYVLGLILQEVATLHYAVGGEENDDVLGNIKDGTLEPLVHQFKVGIDRDLKGIIRKATAFQREDRYQTVRALADDIRSYMQGNEVKALPDNFFLKAVRWTSHHRILMLFFFLLTTLIAAISVSVIIYQNLQRTRLAGERAEAVNFAYSKCITAASTLDRMILNQEKNLTLLAAHVVNLLKIRNPKEPLRFTIYDAAGNVRTPSDAVFSEYYRDKVSFSEGICKFAPDVNTVYGTEMAHILSPLVDKMKLCILESEPGIHLAPQNRDDLLARALSEGMPTKSVYVGLKGGVQFSYPWRNAYSDDFDPRLRPWYVRGKFSTIPVWGKPYVGSDYLIGLSLPCSMQICDEDGNFYGVTGLDISFNKFAKSLLNTGNVGHFVIESALIDVDGRIIVSSNSEFLKTDFDLSQYKQGGEMQMKFFATPKIRRTILNTKYGAISVNEPPYGEVIYLYAQMKSLNWVCIQRINYNIFLQVYRRRLLMEKAEDFRRLKIHSVK